MNSSILRRISLTDGAPPPNWKFRVLDYSALGFILVVPELIVIFRPPFRYLWASGSLLAGGVLAYLGDVAPTIWKRMVNWWPWHQLRMTEAKLAQIEQEISESKKLTRQDKAEHNVQCVGFKRCSDDDFVFATLRFQNVPKQGKLIGKFESPSLRVIYYEASTGQEIADIKSLQWLESEYGPREVNASESYAILASYLQGTWKASEIYRDCVYETRMIHSIDLPATDFRIIARLSGSNQMNIPDVHGVLTLGEDGTASFQRMIN